MHENTVFALPKLGVYVCAWCCVAVLVALVFLAAVSGTQWDSHVYAQSVYIYTNNTYMYIKSVCRRVSETFSVALPPLLLVFFLFDFISCSMCLCVCSLYLNLCFVAPNVTFDNGPVCMFKCVCVRALSVRRDAI